MKKILFSVVFIAVLTGCDKDKFKTQPQIEIQSYNTNVLSPGASLVIDLKFTDKEGDLNGGKFVYIPRRLNRRPIPADRVLDSVITAIPEFPANDQGFFQLRLEWRNLQRSPVENDSIFFRFVVVDRAGNKSDTVNSDRIVILRQ